MASPTVMPKELPAKKAQAITKAAAGGESSVTIHFTVQCQSIRPWELVFVTGSVEQLGSWAPDKAIEMGKRDDSTWEASIRLTHVECRHLLQFRYFVGYYLQATTSPTSRVRIVARWESQRRPRCVLPSVEAINGACRKSYVDEMGFYGGRVLLTDGWLNDKAQHQILLRMHGEALKFYKPRYASRGTFVKITAFDLRYKEVGSIDEGQEEGQAGEHPPTLPSSSSTDVANLRDAHPLFREQSDHGELFQAKNDYLVFRTNSVAPEHMAFRIEFFSEQAGVARHARFALSYCMPSSLQATNGLLTIPILARNQQPIGEIIIYYLTVKAFDTPCPHQMDVSYARHWKKRKQPLEIGHRGWGNSYTKIAAARENTIFSLNQAVLHGADFVEFDVQLTKDKVAVIFHDFHVLISVAKRVVNSLVPTSEHESRNGVCSSEASSASSSSGRLDPSTDYHEMAVKDLKLKQLHLLYVHHHKALEQSTGANKDRLRLTSSVDESEELRPFPTLGSVLRGVHEQAGFNIELKYSMRMQDGSHECENYFERNEYLDIILDDVMRHGEQRRIVFSSFDPDICHMLALKQNYYPVLFLCVGETKRYVPFVDERSCSSVLAVNFAASSNLLGVNFHSEDLLTDPAPVQLAKKFALVSFVWGDDLEDPKCIERFRRELLVDGIIYDRIGEVESRQNVFVVEREMRSTLFRSPSPSRTSSVDKSSTLDLTAAEGVDPANSSRASTKLAGQLQRNGRCNSLFQSQAIDLT